MTKEEAMEIAQELREAGYSDATPMANGFFWYVHFTGADGDRDWIQHAINDVPPAHKDGSHIDVL